MAEGNQGQPAEPAPPPAPAAGGGGKDDRQMAMLCHLAALAGCVIPFGNIIGPLIVWLMKKDQSPLVDQAGKKSLNFQITATIAMLILVPFCFILIGIPLMMILGLAVLIFTIIAAVKTNAGEDYKYPFSIKFLK
jgi:uncharacterized Tic20 family protein